MATHEEDTRLVGSKEGSDKLTSFAPFEAGKTISTSLPYRGEPTKPSQVEINDASYMGQPKVLFRKLHVRSTAATSNTRVPDKSSRGSPQPFADSETSRGGGGGRRVRVTIAGDQSEQEREGGGSRRVVDSGRIPSIPVSKSLVLNRIGTLEKDQDTSQDLKRYWMPDSACKECSECGTKFNIIVRRHHCRICGRIFCNACCSFTIPGMKLRPDLQGNLRVCKECLEIFQEFQTTKRSDGPSLNSDPIGCEPSSVKLRNVSNSLQKNPGEATAGGADASNLLRAGSGNYSRSTRPMTVLSPHKSWDDASSGRSQDDSPSILRMNVGFDNPAPMRSISGQRESFEFLHEREERLMALNEDEVEYVITEVWFQFISPGSGIGPQNHRYRLRTFPNTFSASEIIAWLIRNGHARTRDVAVTMGQALVDTKRLRIVSSLDNQFKDETNMFLEFGQAADMSVEQIESPTDLDAPKWFQRLPENGDSEAERSHSQNPDYEKLSVKYSVPAGVHRASFLSSTQPTITISSMSELTGVVESIAVTEKTQKPQGDYLMIDPESGVSGSALQSASSGNELKLSLHGGDHSMSPVVSTPPPSLPAMFASFSPNNPNTASFTLVNDREIFQAIPVAGLSSAADAAQDLESENGKDVKSNDEARNLFEMEHAYHFDAVMMQLIKSYGISLGWLKVIKPLIMEATRKVKTNVYSSDIMDIKVYVKVKKIPGGRRGDSMLINGVVCTKNITHKKMKISIRNPTVLLLKCGFEFQRRENQLSSFDTLQMQEEKYLKNLVARVKTFQPRVILVQKSVARLALEMFYHLDIVVAVNVKPSVMERVARSTQGDLLHSLDQLFFNVQLGSCGQFHLRNFVLPDGVKKTLMYFDHCDPRLGCAITLMGGSRRELKKVKKATLFGLYVAYNSQLESSFLIDEFAWPASPHPQLLPDMEGYSSSPTTPEWPLYPSVSHPVEDIAPAELTRKLEALAPEFKVDHDCSELTLQSTTPTMLRPSFGSRNTNRSVMSNTRSYSLSGYRSEQHIPNLIVTHDEASEKHFPLVSHSLEDTKSRSDPHSLHYQGIFTDADATTLAQLGEREFEKVLSLQILSITPGVKFPVPYLQTPQGFDADIRNYLPSVIYWSYQFLALPQSSSPKSAGKKSHTTCSSSSLSPHTSALEMGIKKSSLGNVDWNQSIQPPLEPKHENQCKRSYRSISQHPFTTAIFLLKANTNEMKAALADYRANSGLANPSQMFFFPTASRASDYRMQLQNIFNKYQQFNLTDHSDEESESEEGEKENSSGAGGGYRGERTGFSGSLEVSVEKGKAEKPLRQRARRHNTPSFCSSGKEEVMERETSGTRLLVQSCDMPAAVGDGSKDPTGRVPIPENAAKCREKRESNSLAALGSLDDIDKDYSKLAVQPSEDEMLDLHGNEEKSMPPVITEYVTTQFHPSQVDCMDPIHHQSISILFSSTCHDGQRHQLPCVPPCIIQMLYYGRNDISLGDFLKRYCFRPDYRCQTCSSEMTRHQRHIIHGPSALHISVQQLDTSIPRSNDGIFTWLACKHCTLCTPYKKMSDSSLLFSFAKFLELKFHCDQFVTRFHSKADTTCQHSLHSDYLHYFSYRNKIACFQPAEISILEVRIPPTVVVINTPHSEYHHSFSKEIKHIEHITEGVSYRIRQRLHSYNMEPITSQVKEHLASAKGERDAFRSRIKLLKEKVVHGGFLGSGQEEMSEDEREIEFAALQDGIAEIKRALTEFVSCWNIELESLDNKIKVFQSRREVGTSRNSDRDSPFTPMAAEIPISRGTTPHTLLPPQQDDTLLLNTPLSSPPESSLDDIRATGSSLNREASDLTLCVENLTPDSQTEVGEEVRISDDTRSTQEKSTDKTTSSFSDRIFSSSEASQFDSCISLSVEIGGGGGGGGERVSPTLETLSEYEVNPNGAATGVAVPPKQSTYRPSSTETQTKVVGNVRSPHVSDREDEEGMSTLPPQFRRRSLAFSSASRSESVEGSALSSALGRKLVSQSQLSGSAELTKRVTSPDKPASTPVSAPGTPVSFDENRPDSSTCTSTPNITVSEDDMGETEREGEGEREGWWNEGSSPMSNISGGWNDGTASESEEKSGYQSVKTLVVAQGGSGGQKTEGEGQPDGVGIFAKFRGTKDAEVREDPTRFYLMDAAELSKAGQVYSSKAQEGSQQPHHGYHGQRPHRRPGTVPRKNGPSSTPSSTDTDGRTSKGQKEKERATLTRPFQKLPPPFELNEHHNMHKSLKIPIAIYEKEPTSLIAYALSSREYAQEYWAMVERRTNTVQPEKLSQPSSPKAPKKLNDPPLFQVPPPTKASVLKQAYQELKKKGPLNAMNVFSGLADRSDPHDKSGDESRRIEAALSSKSSQTSSSSTPSKSSQTSSSSFPATDQSAVPEDGEGFRWNTTGDHASTGSSSKAGHIYLEFTAPDRSSSIFCKVYFAEEFHRLRETVFPSGEDKFIRSLSRCVKFDAKGGKSRSTFCKVIDDRFIMKQIKSVEISSFEQIAPLYFDHITSALENKRPLVLAKILGVYSIGYRNTRTGNSKRLDVIVMENLLYGRRSSKVFDLKGSMRSRYIDPSKDSSSDVLLDENFLNHICYAPVYVYPHSKAVLMRAIQEDTEFLAQNAVMDYSLLTCIDDQTGELVVGIIDYVRTFTLDKRLEMYIKKTAGRALPTVVYPELYRKRFCEAMDRYFTVVPDKWTGLGADVKI